MHFTLCHGTNGFFDPIELPNGRKLVTLRDAAQYTTKLPKAEQQIAEWQAAVEALLLVVDHNGPTMMAWDRRHAGIPPNINAAIFAILCVEFPSRFRRCGKPIALATSVRRRQLRKQFCAALARARFHTAWTRSPTSDQQRTVVRQNVALSFGTGDRTDNFRFYGDQLNSGGRK